MYFILRKTKFIQVICGYLIKNVLLYYFFPLLDCLYFIKVVVVVVSNEQDFGFYTIFEMF